MTRRLRSESRPNLRDPERWNTVPVPERVATRAINNVEATDDGCWISRYSVGSHGYAQIGWVDKGKTKTVLAHRAAWVHVNGQLPIGMTLDHLCKHRRCVNPDHLRLLSNVENARRNNGSDWPMGQCANGHSNALRTHEVTRVQHGRKRDAVLCAECRRLHFSRNNWKTRHPGEPFPEHLLLATEREESCP